MLTKTEKLILSEDLAEEKAMVSCKEEAADLIYAKLLKMNIKYSFIDTEDNYESSSQESMVAT